MITIEPLKPADSLLLSAIARRAYADHFRYLWYDDGEAYIERSFSQTALENELNDAGNLFFAAYFDNEPAGFLKLRPENTLPLLARAKAFEIERIYLAREFKGKGIGRRMMDTAADIAESLGKDLIWLKVMAGNDASIGFYSSCGYSICGGEVLKQPGLRPEHSGMYVMCKELHIDHSAQKGSFSDQKNVILNT